eukprot:9984_1
MATTGYQPTQLALDIHDLPHYNFDLQQVDGQFTVYYSGSFDNYEYGQTVVVAAGFLIGFLLLYWIALSVWGCCCSANCKRACGCNQCAVATSDEAGATTIKPARAALLFTTLLCVTVVAIAVWGYTVPSGIGKATDKLKTLNGNMKSIVDSLVTSADQFILTTDSAINQTNTLATQVNAVDPALSTSITGVGSQLQSTKTAIEGFRSVAVGLEWNNMDVNDKLDEFKKTYYDVFYALLVTGVLAAFLLVLRTWCVRRNSSGSSQWTPTCTLALIVILMSLGYIAFALEFILLWVGSDFCVEADRTFLEIVRSSVAGSGTEMYNQAAFYTLCDEAPIDILTNHGIVSLENPLNAKVGTASTAVGQAISGLTALEATYAAGLSTVPAAQTTITDIRTSLVSLQTQTASLVSLTECNPLNANYQLLLFAVCDDFLKGSGELALSLGLQILFLALAVMCGCVTQIPSSNRVTHSDGVEMYGGEHRTIDVRDRKR